MLNLVHRFKELHQVHRTLYTFTLLIVGSAALLIAGIFLDPRYIGGAPAWLKPTKFALSIVLYSASMLWILSFLQGRARLVRFAGFWIVAVMALELGIIALQAARGVGSHFNASSPLDSTLYSIMGIAITSLWLLHLVISVFVMRQKLEGPVLALSLRLGLVLSALGIAEAFLMTSPTALQLAGLSSGTPLTVFGAHSVGVTDGGPGLPGLGWSTQGGDLRVGHFVGIHALQVLPLLGWLLASAPQLLEQQKVRLVWLGALGYTGGMVLVTLQALRGQSIVSPDALTLSLGSGLSVLVVGAGLWIARGRGKNSRLGAVSSD